MFDIYRKQLPDWEYRLVPTDTRSIVIAVFFALGFTITMQVTERLDTAVFGGVIPLFGIVFGSFWFTWGAMYMGLTGGIAVAWINPIVANLTATGPLAPFHFTFNTLYCVPMALMVRATKPKGRGFSFREWMTLHMIASILTLLPLLGIHTMFLGFTWPVAIVWYVIGVAGMAVNGFIGFPLCHRLLNTGLLPVGDDYRELPAASR